MQIIFDGAEPKLMQVEQENLVQSIESYEDGGDWFLSFELTLELRFDRRVEVLEIRPEGCVEFTEWVEEGNDQILILHFQKEA